MKWLAYAVWLVVWFLIHSFIFTPILTGSPGPIVGGLAMLINVAILVGGLWAISRRFKPAG